MWDADGRRYLDLLAGIAVNALGHAHPAVVEAVSTQVATLGHVSNLYAAEPPIRLAERLLALAGRPGRVFFANSGAEANEAAFKIDPAHRPHPRHRRGRGGFHGRTMGALALTGQPAKADPFRAAARRRHRRARTATSRRSPRPSTTRTAAVLLEPIQGEGGVVVPARRLPARGAASRPRRTARCCGWTRCRPASAAPALVRPPGRGRRARSGHPGQGAGRRAADRRLLAFGDAAGLLAPGSHGSTFGGNPVSCAAALAVLDTMESEGLLGRAAALGERLRRRHRGIGHPLVAGVRGRGLLLGIVLAAADRGRRRGRPARRGASWSTRWRPTSSGWRPRWSSPTTRSTSFLAALPAALDAALAAAEADPASRRRRDGRRPHQDRAPPAHRGAAGPPPGAQPERARGAARRRRRRGHPGHAVARPRRARRGQAARRRRRLVYAVPAEGGDRTPVPYPDAHAGLDPAGAAVRGAARLGRLLRQPRRPAHPAGRRPVPGLGHRPHRCCRR